MFAAYWCDPAGVDLIDEEDKTIERSLSKPAETLLMVLLFVYLTICVNTEHTYSSE